MPKVLTWFAAKDASSNPTPLSRDRTNVDPQSPKLKGTFSTMPGNEFGKRGTSPVRAEEQNVNEKLSD